MSTAGGIELLEKQKWEGYSKQDNKETTLQEGQEKDELLQPQVQFFTLCTSE